MKRIASVVKHGTWNATEANDSVTLDADDRHRRRVVMTTEAGDGLLLDLPHPIALRDGDGLVLEDQRIVRVVAKPEPVLDIEAANATELTRLAWHLGNRHTEVQICESGGLRIRADHVLADMLRGLGARVSAREAPFEPEAGAYDHVGHGHAHHAHARDHGHLHEHDHSDHHREGQAHSRAGEAP